jgi:Domain of unknown function (DUF4412)
MIRTFRILPPALLLAIFATFASVAAGADTLLTLKAHSDTPALMGKSINKSDKTVTVWVGPNRVRRDDGNAASIVLFDQKKLYIVDHRDKSYTAIDLPVDFAKLVPGAQGDLLKKEMSNTAKMDVKISKTSETKKIGAWNTRKYHVELSNTEIKIATDMWVSKDVPVDNNALRQMQLNMASLQPGSLDWVKKMQEVDGFPVLQESSINFGMPQDTKTREELVSVEKKDPPAGTFAPPAGYTQKPFVVPGSQAGGPAPAAKPAPPRKPGTKG